MLAGRRILLGVTGGVAAYKAAYLARRLVEGGADVRTILTAAAGRFLGAQTLAAITGHHPETELFAGRSVSPHTELARWAEVVVVAPATAATMARLAHGLSEDLLSATLLATARPVLLAPAMHTEMWAHPATRRNMTVLAGDGHHVVGPEHGSLAGGDEGPGRMADPDEIVAALVDLLEAGVPAIGERDLTGWQVLVTAGGTREPIDPVRYVGNRSSGKMGNAVALAAAIRGARVTLVTTVPGPGHEAIEVIRVETAREMAEAVWARAGDADAVVMAAAVADFRPVAPAASKLKRSSGLPVVEFEPTPDILAGVAAMSPRPLVVGFAAEVGSLEDAVAKAERKGVDLLVANDVSRPGSGFGSDTNEVTLIRPDGRTEAWELLSKQDVAHRLWTRLIGLRSQPDAGGAR